MQEHQLQTVVKRALFPRQSPAKTCAEIALTVLTKGHRVDPEQRVPFECLRALRRMAVERADQAAKQRGERDLAAALQREQASFGFEAKERDPDPAGSVLVRLRTVWQEGSAELEAQRAERLKEHLSKILSAIPEREASLKAQGDEEAAAQFAS